MVVYRCSFVGQRAVPVGPPEQEVKAEEAQGARWLGQVGPSRGLAGVALAAERVQSAEGWGMCAVEAKNFSSMDARSPVKANLAAQWPD